MASREMMDDDDDCWDGHHDDATRSRCYTWNFFRSRGSTILFTT